MQGSKENKATIDFSGENGRVVSDPTEVLKIQSEIAFEIPKTAKRRSVVTATSLRNNNNNNNNDTVVSLSSSGKAWFHGKMDREQAIKTLKKHGTKEG